MYIVFNIVFSASVISFVAWLSGQAPHLAGFIIALPLTTLLVLPLSYWQHGNAEISVNLAKSISIAAPISLVFFIPFLRSGFFRLTFWQAYGASFALLFFAYHGHRLLVRFSV
jgi:hypothetical protein